MYLDGQKISADDHRLTHSSYRTLGLRCTVCGEPVQYKNGRVNVAHFAHFPTIDPEKYEECDRRRTSNGDGGRHPDWWFDQGQRLKLFQKHFLRIIQTKIPSLEIDLLDSDLAQNTEYREVQLEALDLLRKRKEDFIRHVRDSVSSTKIINVKRKTGCEALDYLTVASSKSLFMLISRHLILYSDDFYYPIHDPLSPKELCYRIASILTAIDWFSAFTEIIGSELSKNTESDALQRENAPIKLFEKVEDSRDLLVYIREGKMFLGTVRSQFIENKYLLGSIDLKSLLKSKREEYRRKETEIGGSFTIQASKKYDLSR